MSMLLLSSSTLVPNHAFAATAPDLGTSSEYAVLGSTSVTNDNTLGDETVITGKLGIFPSSSITGFFDVDGGTGTVIGGSSNIEQATAAASLAKDHATTAFAALDQVCTEIDDDWPTTHVSDVNMNGMTLAPGVYCGNSTISISSGGVLTLDGPGVYIFKAGSTLTTVSNSNVVLTGGATADNVFWRVGSSATLAAPVGGENTLSTFYGTVIAFRGIHQTGGIDGTILAIEGRLISLTNDIKFASSTTVTVPTPIDTVSPTISITSSSGSSGSTVSSTTLSYTATFSESVTDFTLGDITVTGTANGTSPVASNFTGNGTTYTFDVLRGSSDGTVVVSIAADKAIGTNGHTNLASNTYTLTIDTPSEVTNPPASNATSYTLNNTSGGDTVPIGLGYTLATLNVEIENGNIAFDNTAFVGGIATLTTALTVNAPSASVVIPAGTTINGTGWDGVLTLPSTTSVSVNGFVTGLAIQFGDPDRKLTFGSPVSVTLLGQSGKSVFITEFDGTQNQVTVECDAEPPTNTAGFACYVDNGTDIVIYTETASTFSSGSPTATSPEQETSTGTSKSSTIPIISMFNINADESGNSVFYDFTGSTTMLKATTGEKITLQVTLDDEEASTKIIHFGLYTNIRKTSSDIKNSNAYVIFDMGLPLKVVDTEGLFKDVQLNTLYQGKSMIVDIILTFDKPMNESDMILEVWNQGRHPRYETIPSILAVTEPDMSGPNISGLVTMPEVISKKPLKIFSTAGGQITEIKNNDVLVLKNKDVGIKISGFIEDAARGDKVNLIILRPDDSVYTIDAYVNSDDSYSILTKLHTKWASGFYEILISYNEKEQGTIRFYITDKDLI